VPFTWSSSDGAVATVDAASGLATATGNGSTTIKATSGTVSGSATLSVSLTASVASVTVSPASATLTALGATQRYTAVARDAGGNVLPGITFTWSSSDAAVATIDASTGLATAVGNGSDTIAAVVGGVRGTAGLVVSQQIARIVVNPDSATLYLSAPNPMPGASGSFRAAGVAGPTQQFTAEALDANGNAMSGVAFTWASSDTTVATVDSSGLATAVGLGTASISATASGVRGAAKLTVANAPS